MIKVKINGQTQQLENNTTILKILNEKNIHKDSVVIVLNDKIIKKGDLENFFLNDGDALEILRFVGGG